jgi:hypothetical protein
MLSTPAALLHLLLYIHSGGEMQSYWLLKQVVRIVTTGILNTQALSSGRHWLFSRCDSRCVEFALLHSQSSVYLHGCRVLSGLDCANLYMHLGFVMP